MAKGGRAVIARELNKPVVVEDVRFDSPKAGEVLVKVICNSAIAFVIFTAHHFLEERMNHLISRNA